MSVRSLSAHNLTKSYSGRVVLDGISLQVSPGQRLGLVGENGVGKSTLLRLLAGQEFPDSGEVSLPVKIGFLSQELPFSGDVTVSAVQETALQDIRNNERELVELASQLERDPENAELLAGYGQALDWAQVHQTWDVDRQVELILAGLGLAAIQPDRPLATLSGGERSRLALAVLLLQQPDVVLLDEPTNHLDDAAISFLESRLIGFNGAVMVASHDRAFLDAICTDICDLDPTRGGITWYGGTYSNYIDAKHQERKRWEQEWCEQRDEIARLNAAIKHTPQSVAHNRPSRDNDKYIYHFRGERVTDAVSGRVRSTQRRLDELLKNQIPKPRPPLRFAANFAVHSQQDGLAMSLRNIVIPRRLDIPALDISAADQLLVTGANGAGKSTLLAVLAEQLIPDQGIVHRRPGFQVGLLKQDVTFVDPALSARAIYAAHHSSSADRPDLLELGLLPPRDVDRPVGELSVGQRRRLALALLLSQPPEVLLLDEPTNHISLALVEELENAIQATTGAIVAATHDRWLRQKWSGPELHLSGGRIITRR